MSHSTRPPRDSFPLVEPPPPPPRTIRPFGLAVVIALGVSALVQVVGGLVALTRVALIDEVAASPDAIDLSAVHSRDGLHTAVDVAGWITYLITGSILVVWLFRARANAESITHIAHRRARPWLLLAWLVPPVNLWYPKQIMDDLWRTSQPQGLEIMDLYRARRPLLVGVWWTFWLVALAGEAAVRLAPLLEESSLLRLAARVEVGLPLAVLIAAALAARIVLKISDFQEAHCAETPAPASAPAAPPPAVPAPAPAPRPAAAETAEPDRPAKPKWSPKRTLPKRVVKSKRAAGQERSAEQDRSGERPRRRDRRREEHRPVAQERLPEPAALSIATFPPPVPLSAPVPEESSDTPSAQTPTQG